MRSTRLLAAYVVYGALFTLSAEPASAYQVSSDEFDLMAPGGVITLSVVIPEGTGELPVFYTGVPGAIGMPPLVWSETTGTSQIISDVFGFVANPNDPNFGTLAIMSDTNESGVDLALAMSIFGPVLPGPTPEPAGFFDVTPWLRSDFVAAGYHAQFMSDPVPEPSSFFLGIAGLASLGLVALRKKLRRA
jgi:hypothetical protein